MKGKIFLIVILLVVFTFSICYAIEFNDVSKDHWAYEYINKLSNDGIINGFEDGTFRPSYTLTRAQFIKLMVSSDKLLVQKMDELLSDYNVNKQWYENYFDIAEEYYLLPAGYNINNLDAPILRKDMAEILSNFIKFVFVYNSLDTDGQAKLKQELDANSEFINDSFSEYLTEIDIKLVDSFSDVIDLDKKSQENIFIVKDLGIINGYEDGTFRPYNSVTRAEASKVIAKYIDESGVGIIISTMIHNEAQDVISNATSQIDALAIQMFNSRFEPYEGNKRSKSIAKSLVNMILASNNSMDQKISVEVIDSNGTIINDKTISAINDATTGTTFDISFQKDSKGYINKAIIKAILTTNNSNTEQNNSNENQVIIEKVENKPEKVIIDVPDNLTDDTIIKITVLEKLDEKDFFDVSFWYADYAGTGWGPKDEETYTIKEIKREVCPQWGEELKSGEEVMIMAYIKYNDPNKEEVTVTKTIVLP